MNKFPQMTIFALALMLTACGVPIIPIIPTVAPAPTATATALPLPPTVVETVPQIGSELGPKATLLVFFSVPMDKTSVEAALTSDFANGQLLNWVDNVTLAITPKTGYPTNGQVTFTLANTAKSADGLALPDPVSLSYKTASPLRVSQVLPESDAVDISPDSAVVVTFNQPVVALGADATASLPVGLTLEPAAQGKGEWLNTSTYTFHPEPSLAGGTDYTVHVNPQLSATNGAALDTTLQNTTWTFRTSLPRLLEVTPKDSDGPLLLDPELKLTFNQPMDRASVEGNLALNGPRDTKLDGSFVWNDKSTVVTFKPSALLARSTPYTLTLSGQARSHGGATLGSDVSFNYQSVAPFAILSTPFTSGTARPRDKGISITFTAPFDSYKNSELEALITVSPKVEYSGYSISGQNINVNNLYRPGQSYIITFSRDLKDRWGQALGTDATFSFREPDADPSVGFASYSPVLFTTVASPRLSVQAVNVDQLDIVLGSFSSLTDFFRYQSDYDYQQHYTPTALDSWSELLDLAPNQNKPYTVDLLRNGKRAPLPTGLYYLDVSSKKVAQARQAVAPVLISNVNLTLKTDANQALLWAVDLRTQTPAANQAVTLYSAKGLLLASGTTDANGIWKSEFTPDAKSNSYENTYVVLAQPGDDLFGMAADGWNAEVSPWNFGLITGNDALKPTIYMYTERPVYRPGDVVNYRGIIRNIFDGRYTDAKTSNIIVAFNSASGKVSQNVAVSAYGSFSGEFRLSDTAIPGYYTLDANKPDQAPDQFINGSSVSFQIAEYRKPEINLTATLLPTIATNGQALTGTVNATYFFGAPVNDLPFEWRLYKNTSSFDLPGYSTGLYQANWYESSTRFGGAFGESIANGTGRTGVDGNFSIALNEIKVDDTAKLTLEITASESGGFPVSAHATTTLHPTDFYIGIRPDTWFGRAGSPLGFDALTVDLDKKALSGKTLTASFQKVTWERNDLTYGYNFTASYTELENRPITSGADGKAHVTFTPTEAGTYMLEIAGEGAKSQTLVWVGGAENAAWPNLPYQRMELTANQSEYKPGETAGVFIPGAFAGPALALITTERSSILSSEVVSVPPEGYTFNLPLTDDQAPNTYVSVTMLGPDSDFRQGYINLTVEPSAFKLNVDLKATPAKAKPGDKLTLDLTVTDAKGQPVQAEFSMAVVDLAALALAEPNSEEIVPAFYGKQPLGVSTGLTAAIYARRLLSEPLGGGGGGGGDVLTLREKFPDTAYWKADIVTDAQGKAQITLTLPDNLTTWQVDARGLTQDTKVGQAVVRMVTSKELLIRPQTPHFLVVGDHTELAAIVNNNTAADLEATVSLQATAFSLDDPTTVQQKVQVPANGRIRVAWSGTIKAEDVVKTIFTVKSGALEDSARPNDGDIPVLRYSAPQAFSTAGVLSDAASRLEILAMPKSFKPLGGKLDLELSPSLASVIVSEIQSEKAAPEEINWNNERLASHLLSRLATYQTLKDTGLSSDPLNTSIVDDAQRLMANQSYIDNAWAWTTSDNTSSDPYLTAYILLALNKLSKTAGIDINLKDSIDRGYAYLVAAPPFDAQTDLSQPWALNRAAFHNYVLQQINSANLNTLDTLYNGRANLAPWARALLADTLLAVNPNDERAKTLFSDLQSSAIRSATGAHWEDVAGDGRNPNSPLFTTAVVVYTLAQRDPANPILPDAARYLASQRAGAQGWGSSYEKTWVILALNQYMKGTGELKGSFNFSAALNNTPFAKGDAAGAQKLETVSVSAPFSRLYPSNSNSLLISREAGDGKLYYRAALMLDLPVESAPPINQGLTVSRQFVTCNGADCQPITSFQMPATSTDAEQPTANPAQPPASRVKVRVTLTLPHDSYYLMVQDNIPAGAEILDSSLKTSQQGEPSQTVEQSKGPLYDSADPFGAGWGWWYFNPAQIYTDHILWSADYLPAGTYVLTYTIVPSLPGQYHVLPAHAWQAYFPEVQGTSAGAMFEIKP